MTDSVVEAPAAPAPTGVVADLTADVSAVEADIKADVLKAQGVFKAYGIAFVGLLVGWILGKIF